jgi:GDSL-like Lipase/Acylhydrolase family
VIGDSIAVGMGDPTEGYATATWGGRVAAALARERDGVTYTNLARHRAKAADIRDSQLGPALELEPDLVALIGGGNDLLTGKPVDITDIKAVLDEIVVALMDAGATVVTFETLDFPRQFTDPAFALFNRGLADLYAATRMIARERGTVHADCYTPAWSRERYCFSDDLQHPTMRTQALAASTVIRALGEHLGNDRR